MDICEQHTVKVPERAPACCRAPRLFSIRAKTVTGGTACVLGGPGSQSELRAAGAWLLPLRTELKRTLHAGKPSPQC